MILPSMILDGGVNICLNRASAGVMRFDSKPDYPSAFSQKMRPDECLLLLSSAGKVLWAGTPAGGFLGCTRGEWIAMDLPLTGHGPTAPEGLLAPVTEAFQAAVAGVAGEAEGTADFDGKTGSGIRLHWKLAVLPAASGDSQVLLALFHESSSSSDVRVEEDREVSFENALEGIFRSTPDGVLLAANPVFARMFGYGSPEEMMKEVKSVGSEIAADSERCRKFFQMMEKDGSVEGFELEVLRAGGTVFWVAVSARMLRGVPGRAPRLEGRVIDITKQKRAEQESERSRRQLRDLRARLDDVREEERTGIARELHDELGKSLTMLTLDLAWLRGRLVKTVPEDVRTPLERKIATMEQTIKVTLDTLRRILSALRPPLLDELGLKEAIEFEVEEFSRRMGIRFEMKATVVTVTSDRTRTAVFRIFQEVLTNVARHARASRIKVDLSEADSAMVLVVEDNGCGISEEDLARSRCFGILGIQERALGIGGAVEFGGNPGSGTRVTLRVPLAMERSPGVAGGTDGGRASKAPDAAGQPERISEETPQRVFAFDELRPRRR